jgi:hypothetical protein
LPFCLLDPRFLLHRINAAFEYSRSPMSTLSPMHNCGSAAVLIYVAWNQVQIDPHLSREIQFPFEKAI